MSTHQLGQDEESRKDCVRAFTSQPCLVDGDTGKHSDLDGNESQKEERKGIEILTSGALVSASFTEDETKEAHSIAMISCSLRLVSTAVQ